jgi:hypothetical protein
MLATVVVRLTVVVHHISWILKEHLDVVEHEQTTLSTHMMSHSTTWWHVTLCMTGVIDIGVVSAVTLRNSNGPPMMMADTILRDTCICNFTMPHCYRAAALLH